MRFKSFLKRYIGIENPSVPINGDTLNSLSSIITADGKAVNTLTVLSIPAVARATNIISSTISGLPLQIKQDYKELDLPILDWIAQPSDDYTFGDMIEACVTHLLLRGNAYLWIKRRKGQPYKLLILQPDDVRIERQKNGYLAYYWNEKKISYLDIIHFKEMTLDGICGIDKIQLYKDIWSLALSNISYAKNYYANNATLGGVLEHPGSLSETAYKRLLSSWEKRYQGSQNAGRTAILEEGMKFTSIGTNPNEASFEAVYNVINRQISQIFGVPLFLLSDLAKSTFNNVENLSLQFVKYTILPLINRIERELTSKLLLETQKEAGMAFNFDLSALTRGDQENRAEYLSKLINAGIISPNEGRKMENLEPIPEGDKHLIQVNMTTLENIQNGKEL